MDSLVIDTVKSFAKLYPDYDAEIAQIITHLEAKEAFKALKVAHGMLERFEKTTKAATVPATASEPVVAAV